MARPMSKSFYDWCIENNHEDWLELWDYELNKCNPKDISYGTDSKHYFKCPRRLHLSELKSINSLTNNCRDGVLVCNQCNSLGQWLIDTYGEDALERYWDYEMNKVSPFALGKKSHQKIWIKCVKTDYHPSYETSCTTFTKSIKCPYCDMKKVHPKDSFGQLLVDEYGSLDIIWDFEKNGDLNPFSLAKKSAKKVWLFCLEKDHHGSYEITCANHSKGQRCSYCNKNSGKVHPKDSFAQYHIDNTDPNFLEKYWSKNNTVDPFSITPCTSTKVWIICQKDEEHEDYEIRCYNFTYGKRCNECNESKGEREISKWLDGKNIKYIREKTFPNLLGVGNDYLRYDFYLPEYNLLIEYQGQYHDGTVKYTNETQEKYEKRFKQQQEHDKRKRKYAKINNIKLLEIWYWDFDNIEEILDKMLNNKEEE